MDVKKTSVLNMPITSVVDMIQENHPGKNIMIGLVSKSHNYLKKQRHFDVYKAKGSDNQDQMERIVSAVVNLAIERMETQNFTRLWF